MQNIHKISEYVKRWGSSASMALLDPKCSHFIHPSIEGVIGYHPEKKFVVSFGDPVCAPKDVPALAKAFHDFSKEQSKDVIYLTASEGFKEWAMNNGCQGLLEVEEELVMDPVTYPKNGSNGRLLRKKMNHAIHANVSIKEYTSRDEKIKQAILEVESAWLKGRKGPQIFLSHVDFFEDVHGKRCFYAEQNGRVVGAILLCKLEAHKGWMLYLLMTVPDAPGGTSEYLVLTALDKLAQEGCTFFSFGISAAEELKEIIGLGNLSAWLARTGFKMTKRIFKLDSRRLFWAKFEPQNKRSFTLFSNPRIGISEFLAIIKTVNASI